MAYSTDINPFTGILCIRYHHIAILILISWITIWIEFSWRKYINKYCDGPLQNARNNLVTKINHIIKNKLKSEFNKLTINNSQIPSDITSIIISMLPEIHENWKKQGKQYQSYIYLKLIICRCSPFVFPILKLIVNVLCTAVIVHHYAIWFGDNDRLSNWDKYCALIISLCYMPNFKGRGYHLFWMGCPNLRFVCNNFNFL